MLGIIEKWEMSIDISTNLTKSTIVDFIDNYLEYNCISQQNYGAYFKKIKAPKNSKAENLLFLSWEEPYIYYSESGLGACCKNFNIDVETGRCLNCDGLWTKGAICSNSGCRSCGYPCWDKRVGALEKAILKIFFNNDGFVINVIEEKKYITE